MLNPCCRLLWWALGMYWLLLSSSIGIVVVVVHWHCHWHSLLALLLLSLGIVHWHCHWCCPLALALVLSVGVVIRLVTHSLMSTHGSWCWPWNVGLGAHSWWWWVLVDVQPGCWAASCIHQWCWWILVVVAGVVSTCRWHCWTYVDGCAVVNGHS